MMKLFGFLGAASTVSLCGLAACTVTSSNDVSGLDGGPKSDASTSGSATDAPRTTTDGGGTDGGGTDGGGTCKVTGGRAAMRRPPSCTACLTSKCCAVTVGCDDVADCSALMACALACVNADSGAAGGAEQDCINDCGTAHPNSIDTFNAANACAKSECPAQCHAHPPFPPPTPPA